MELITRIDDDSFRTKTATKASWSCFPSRGHALSSPHTKVNIKVKSGIEFTEAMLSLMLVIGNRQKRNRLIQFLLTQKTDVCVKVRFLCAVDEYEQIREKVEKLSKGRKIVAT
jgi:hypothetical protein